MAVIVVDVVSPDEVVGTATVLAQVTNVVNGLDSPITTTNVATSVVEVAEPGGTVANVQWGYSLPESPTEGQVFILVTEA